MEKYNQVTSMFLTDYVEYDPQKVIFITQILFQSLLTQYKCTVNSVVTALRGKYPAFIVFLFCKSFYNHFIQDH